VTNKTALYVLLAALVLAALTNRWVAASGSRPAFNIVSFDGLYFRDLHNPNPSVESVTR
jgi:hypothetical protein